MPRRIACVRCSGSFPPGRLWQDHKSQCQGELSPQLVIDIIQAQELADKLVTIAPAQVLAGKLQRVLDLVRLEVDALLEELPQTTTY